MAKELSKLFVTLGLDDSEFAKKLDKAQKSMTQAGKVMTGIGVAIVAGFGLATKAAVEFDTAMREVNTMMQLSESEFQAMKDDVMDLSTSMGVDAVDSAKALYQAISAGVPKENALEFLQVATKAAIGGVTDTRTAVDGLTTVINAFGMEFSEAEKVADIMFTTVKGGKTTFGELADTMSNIAPMAASVGWSFEEVSAAIATMTKQGETTAKSTRELRQVIAALLKPTADAVDIIDKYNLSLYKETEESQRAKDAIPGLRDAVDMANREFELQSRELDKLQAAYQKTTEAMSEMTAEMDDLGDRQAEMRLEIRKIRYAAAQEDRELTEAEQERIKALEMDIEGLGIKYDELSIAKDNASEAAEGELAVLKAAQEENSKLARNIDEATAALAEGMQTYSDASKDVKSLPEIIGSLTEAGISNADIMKLFGSVEAGNAIMMLGANNAEMYAADLEAMANSAGAATDAFEEMEESGGRSWDQIINPIKNFIKAIGDELLPILIELKDKIKPVIENVMKWIRENPGLTKTIIMITAAIGALFAVLGPLLMMLPMIARGFTMLLGPVGAVIGIVAALAAVVTLVIMNWEGILDFFKGLWENVKEAFETAWNTITVFLKGVWENILGFFKGIWEAIVGFVKEHWDKILAILFPAVGLPVLIARNWGKIVDNVKEIWNKVIAWFKGIPEKIGKIFATVKDWILSPFRAAWKGIEMGINWLIRQLNKISVDIPDWVPGVGGKNFGINISEIELPSFQGWEGRVPGPEGKPYAAVVHGGEYISQGPGFNPASIEQAIVNAIDKGFQGVLIQVGGQDVAAIVSREQYNMAIGRRRSGG